MNEGVLVVEGERQYPLTAMAVVARVRLIQEVMANVMKKDVHYGTIPGTPKPTLYKPGAEQLLVTFRIAPAEPKVEDLSTSDSIRYRVTRSGISNGVPVAAGVGEASSDEEKYKWRRPVCDAEFEATPEDRRRLKFKRDGSSDKQIRTNPADVANTILKMADKRAFVAMTLLATAASDCFSQDLEDLPEEVREAVVAGESPRTVAAPKPKVTEAVAQTFGKNADNTLTFVPAVVSVKNGEGAKGPWTKTGIKHGEEWYGTFDADMGKLAVAAKEAKTAVALTWKMDGQYKTIVTLVNA